jgi:hypothetical protein
MTCEHSWVDTSAHNEIQWSCHKCKAIYDPKEMIRLGVKRTTPPARQWVGLTDEDMDFLFPHGSSVWVQETVKILEAKLKEKNT